MRAIDYSWALALVLAWAGAAGVQSADRPRGKPARPALGETASVFVLLDLEGKAFRLKDRMGKRPIVIEFGSYT
jgi:hypothetical protein